MKRIQVSIIVECEDDSAIVRFIHWVKYFFDNLKDIDGIKIISTNRIDDNA